jgi:hypothetical protein
MTADEAAAAGAGLHYRSNDWREIADCGDWSGEWPEIDSRGILTGNAVASRDGYLNVDDEAMIAVTQAVLGRWEIDRDEGRASEPRPVSVEVAQRDETIRICGGLEDYAGLEHTAMPEACEAYHAAACDALRADQRASRLFPCTPVGQRMLHSGWMGAKFSYQCGAIGTMHDLTEDEKAAVSAADDAGREAARKVIAAAEPTRHQIASLQDEAAAAGDDAMQAICSAALDGDPVAVAEVARCLREAAAQSDE